MTDSGSHDRPSVPRGPEASGADPDGVAYGDGLDPIAGPDSIDPGAPDGSIDLSDARGDVDAALSSSDDSAPTPEQSDPATDRSEPRSSSSRRSWLPKRFQRSRSSTPDTDEASANNPDATPDSDPDEPGGPDNDTSDTSRIPAPGDGSLWARLERARLASGGDDDPSDPSHAPLPPPPPPAPVRPSPVDLDDDPSATTGPLLPPPPSPMDTRPSIEQSALATAEYGSVPELDLNDKAVFRDYSDAMGNALVEEAKELRAYGGKDSDAYKAKIDEIDAFLEFVALNDPYLKYGNPKNGVPPASPERRRAYVEGTKRDMMKGIKDAPIRIEDGAIKAGAKNTSNRVANRARRIGRRSEKPAIAPKTTRLTEGAIYHDAQEEMHKGRPRVRVRNHTVIPAPNAIIKWWNNDDRSEERRPVMNEYEKFSLHADQLQREKEVYDRRYGSGDPDAQFRHTFNAAYVENRKMYIEARRNAAGVARQLNSIYTR